MPGKIIQRRHNFIYLCTTAQVTLITEQTRYLSQQFFFDEARIEFDNFFYTIRLTFSV